MTKSELVEAIAARADLSKARAELVVNCVFEAIADALREGKGVEIRGFGSIKIRTHMAYKGRNPRTGKAVHVPCKLHPRFKVGKELKELVNASRDMCPITDGPGDS